MKTQSTPRFYTAVIFDLLTALIDSWTLWESVAPSAEAGRAWRLRYLKVTYDTNAYRPYEVLVRESAEQAGVDPKCADELVRRWLELPPWTEAVEVVAKLSKRVPVGVATNCSEILGFAAARLVSHDFEAVITAERAGYYKPHPLPYQLTCQALQSPLATTLFVAGSPSDIGGAQRVGMTVAWHNRVGLEAPEGTRPQYNIATLGELLSLVN